MIIEIGSGRSGLKDYLENGKKQGRELHRDELDQRIPLAGDLAVFENVTVSMANDGVAYDHITLSFSENHVSNEMLQRTVEEFREHALAAWPERDRDRVPFYAEAHRPRTLSYTNSKTGEQVTRCTHIHIAIGRHDLLTGKAIEVFGYLGERTTNVKYIDAFQESFNARYGFGSPKDNPKITPENAIDTLARYTGSVPDQFGTITQQKSQLEVELQKEIVSQEITSWTDFENLLKKYGEVSTVKKGQFNEYFRLKPKDHKQAMRLTGVFFQRQFIERPTTEKIAIISAKAREAYLEQMQPRKEPKYIAGVLNEWNTFRARENRFLHTGTKFYKTVYKPANAQERLQILDNFEKEHHGISSNSAHRSKQITATRGRLPELPIRDLDAIQERSEMLLRSDAGIHVRDQPSGREKHLSVRQADGSDRGLVKVGQPSSLIQLLQSELLENYEKASSHERFSEIRKNIDCQLLLTKLSHTQKINTALYHVTTAKDGTPRIQCGSRALTPNDFLSKELGLPWRQAAPILKEVYENQINKKSINPRIKAVSSTLWKEFSAQFKEQNSILYAQRKTFNSETRELNKALTARFKNQAQQALKGLIGINKQNEKVRQASFAAQERASFENQREILFEKINIPAKDHAWQCFLHDRAKSGDGIALEELRKLDGTARSVPVASITGKIVLVDGDDEKNRRRKARESASSIFSKSTVSLNGDVTFHNKGGHQVLRDEGNHIAVLDQNDELVIEAGLMLAKERFGSTLSLTGSSEFQQRVVAVAVKQNMNIRFLDPSLEMMRLRLIEESHAAKSKSAMQLQQVSPEIITPDEGIEDSKPEPTKIADLVVQFSKPLVDPIKSNGDVEFTVIGIADDGILVSYGRTVGVHPAPPFPLKIDDKVVIDKKSNIGLVLEKGRGKGIAD